MKQPTALTSDGVGGRWLFDVYMMEESAVEGGDKILEGELRLL